MIKTYFLFVWMFICNATRIHRVKKAGLGFFQATNRIALNDSQIDLWPNKISNIIYAIFDHGWPLQWQSPCNHIHIVWQTHWSQHFRSEHARVAHLKWNKENVMKSFFASAISANTNCYHFRHVFLLKSRKTTRSDNKGGAEVQK